jgi:error-prone DNA polymerase
VWSALAPKKEPLFAHAERLQDARDSSAPPSHPLEPEVTLPKLTRTDQLLLDYERTGMSVADHPMRILRPRLPKGVLSSHDLAKVRHGTHVRSAGVVLCRQRPMTASGVVFVTLEDEHGFVNLVLFAKTFERLRRVATTSSMLYVEGKVERQAESSEAPVVYIVVEKLERMSLRGKSIPAMSRDFR